MTSFKNKYGFTLMEMILVVAMIGVFLGMTGGFFGNLFLESALGHAGDRLVSALRDARAHAVASDENSDWGVYADAQSNPNRVILFKGSSYLGRSEALDQVTELPASVHFLISDEIIFEKRSGMTLADSFTLQVQDLTQVITINRLGTITYE